MGVRNFLRTVIPEDIRAKILEMPIAGDFIKEMDFRKMRKLYSGNTDAELQEMISYVGKHRNQMPGVLIQSSIIDEYMHRNIEVKYDKHRDLKYVEENNKRLYYCREMTTEEIISSYNNQAMEQDTRSGHCYFRDMSLYPDGGVFVDIGGGQKEIFLFV